MVIRRSLLLGAAATLAALVPLFGDPRSAPITHPEWARMLLRGMEMDEALDTTASASRVFSTLSWRESLWLRAGQYMRSEGVQLVRTETEPLVLATSELGQVIYPIAVVRRGDYRLRVKLSGDPASPAVAEIAADGASSPAESYTLVPGALPTWLAPEDAMHLQPGTYYATFALPKGTRLEQFEIIPPCVTPVEPIDGWQPADVVDAEDLAVTMVRALDREHELPPAAVALEMTGRDFKLEDGVVMEAAVSEMDALWLRAGKSGSRASLHVDLPDDGLYTVSAFGMRGNGQQWLADACRTAVQCPAPPIAAGESEAPVWLPVMTAQFSKGRHFFTVTLGPGAAIERVRIERKKATGADYIATLRRIGFDAGEGPVSRPKAVDALEFLTKRYREDIGRPCIIPEYEPPGGETILAAGAPISQPQPPPGNPGPPPPIFGGPPPIEPPRGPTPPPVVPCEVPASPITPVPCPSPST